MEATNRSFRWTARGGRSTSCRSGIVDSTGADRAAFDQEQEVVAQRALTLREWLDQWLEICATRGLRPSTVASYTTMLQLHVDGRLAATTLANIAGRELSGLYVRLLREGRRGNGFRRLPPIAANVW